MSFQDIKKSDIIRLASPSNKLIGDLKRLVAELESGSIKAESGVVVLRSRETEGISISRLGPFQAPSDTLGMLAFASHLAYESGTAGDV